MGLELARAYVRIVGDASGLRSDLNQAISQVGNALAQSAAVSTAVVAGMTAGAAALAGGLSIMALRFATVGHEIDVLSERLRVDSTMLQEWQYIAGKTGISALQLFQMFDSMTKNLGRLDVGKERVEALKELGIHIESFRQLSPEEQFITLADAISKMSDKSRALGQAQFILGEHVVRLLPLLNLGREGITALREEYHKLGLGLSGEQVEAATALRNALFQLKAQFGALVLQLGAAVAPMLTDLLNHIQPVLASIINWVRANQSLVVTIFKIATGIALAGASILAFKAAVATLALSLLAVNTAFKASLLVSGFKVIAILTRMTLQTFGLVLAMGLWKFTIMGVTGAIRLLGMAIRTTLIASGAGAVVVFLGLAMHQFLERIREGQVDLSRFKEILFLLKEIVLNLSLAFRDLGIDGTTAADSIQNGFNRSISSIILFLDWVSLLTTNWRLTWDLMLALAQYGITAIKLRFLQLLTQDLPMLFINLVAISNKVFEKMIVFATNFGHYLVQTFISVVLSIGSLFNNLWESIKNGFDLDLLLVPAIQKFEERIAELRKTMPELFSSEKFFESLTGALGTEGELQGELTVIQSEIDKILKQMQTERNKLREERVRSEEAPKEEEKAQARQQQAILQAPLLEAGRSGFRELGTKVQDALLDRQDSLDSQRNNFLQQGLKKQDKIIEELQELGGLGGLA